MSRRWTQEEKDSLGRLAGQGWTIAEIAEALGRPWSPVRAQVRSLGLEDATLPTQRPPPGKRTPCASSFAVAGILGTENRGWGTFLENDEEE